MKKTRYFFTQNCMIFSIFRAYFMFLLFISFINIAFAQQWLSHELSIEMFVTSSDAGKPLEVRILEPEKGDYVLPQQFKVELDFGEEVLFDSLDDIIMINGDVVQNKEVYSGDSLGRVIFEIDLNEIENDIKKNQEMILSINEKSVDTPDGVSLPIEVINPKEVEFYIGVAVWPGDTNNDKKVDILDILPIGLFYDKLSSEKDLEKARTDTSDDWEVHIAKPWDPDVNQYDRAFADANGDGIIDENDVLPIVKNWGKSTEIALSPKIGTEIESGIGTNMLEVYRRMYSVLSNLEQETEAVFILKKAISQIISKLQSQQFPKNTELFQNFPNPFNPETWIPYQLAESAEVNISIYNISGNLIRKLELGHKSIGFYIGKDKAAYWDGRNKFGEPVASGLYFYNFQAADYNKTGRMIILK